MKKIVNIFYTICLFLIIYIVYINIDKISNFFNNLMLNKYKVKLEDPNIYKRDYNFSNFTYNEDYIPLNKDGIINIYYNVLNNGWETFTFYCPSEYTECINDVKSISNDEELLSNINNYVHTFNSFKNITVSTSSLGEVSLNIDYKYDSNQINEINFELDNIISSLNLQSLSEEEKIRKFHEYLIDNITYNKDENKDGTSAYNALLNGYAVCSGYTDAMGIFLDRYNIPNIKISSKDHIWNLVYINDKWLHLDTTWDDTDIEKYNNYNYFLITKEKLHSLDTTEHIFDEDFFIEGR